MKLLYLASVNNTKDVTIFSFSKSLLYSYYGESYKSRRVNKYQKDKKNIATSKEI